MSYHSAVARHPGLVVDSGWSHSFAATLRATDAAERFLYHVSGEGLESEYIRQGENTWTAFEPGELRGSVTRSGNHLELTDLDGMVTSSTPRPAAGSPRSIAGETP